MFIWKPTRNTAVLPKSSIRIEKKQHPGYRHTFFYVGLTLHFLHFPVEILS